MLLLMVSQQKWYAQERLLKHDSRDRVQQTKHKVEATQIATTVAIDQPTPRLNHAQSKRMTEAAAVKKNKTKLVVATGGSFGQ